MEPNAADVDVDRFCELVAVYFELPTAPTADTLLIEELGFDSVAIVELMLLIEELTGHAVATDQLGRLQVIRDAHRLLRFRREPGEAP